MKKTLAIMGMGLVGITFGLDEYLSIEKGKVEIDAGYWLNMGTGSYDNDGEKIDNPDDRTPMTHLAPLQLKYGIMDGLDVEVAASLEIENGDAGDESGLTPPQIALKYTHAPIHAGAFINLGMPFATGDYADPSPPLTLGLGAVYGNRFGDFRLTGIAGYLINLENSTDNLLFAYAKPEAMWTEFIGTYLGLRYDMVLDADDDAYLFSLVPGANVQLLPWLAYEVNAPITLLGKNSGSSWGIGASVYVTLPK